MSNLDVFTHYRRISLLQSTQSILAWDSEVCLPEGSLNIRHAQIEALDSEIHRLSCSKEFIDGIISFSPKNLEEIDQLRNLRRFAFRNAAVETGLNKELTRKELIATEKWKVAKKESNFRLVEKDLEELLNLRRQRAEQIKSFEPYHEMRDSTIYDVMIDAFEPGLKNQDISLIFNRLKRSLIPRLRKVSYDSILSKGSLEKKVEDQFIRSLVQRFGFDLTKGRLDFTKSYPFCGGWNGDVRITTQENASWIDNLLMTMHEMGHGIYQQSLPEILRFTPAGFGASTGFHESQSRFYENQIGRSPAFIKFISDSCHIPQSLLIPQMNGLRKSPIRTQADELAYNLHIILRWEIEQDLLAGTIKFSDVPELWNKKMTDYFGIKIENDSEGCLQDLHWFMSDFGWFNSYCLGNLIAAQFFHLFTEKFSDWDSRIESGNFLFIKDFLGVLHRLAGTKDFNETAAQVFGKPVSEIYFVEYIDKRYFSS